MGCSDREVEYLIVGGGVAGLAAANRLVDAGERPLLVEAGGYPSHKVCGEFFSGECTQLLRRWELPSSPSISHVRFHSKKHTFSFALPHRGVGLSHLIADPHLYRRAVAGGAEIMTDTSVVNWERERLLTLSTGERIQAKKLLIAAGRLCHRQQRPQARYIGIKAHFAGVQLREVMEFFLLPGCYLGVSAVEGGKCNVACLAMVEALRQDESAEAFMARIASQTPQLSALLGEGKCLFASWMSTSIPEFGVKRQEGQEQLYYLGDARGTIAPIGGFGLSLALLSGAMAADFARRGEWREYDREWRHRFTKPILCASYLSRVALSPHLSRVLVGTCSRFPKLASLLYAHTRVEC